ncbi:MAG: hypothetical protein ACI8PT_002296 [Gammaproteobacteria bacterium]|jgi:hypothetical protein
MPGLLDPEEPADAGVLSWCRNIVAALVDAVERGDPAAGVRAFFEAWNDTPWDALPRAVKSTFVERAARLAQGAKAMSYFAVPNPLQVATGCTVTLLHGRNSPPNGGTDDRKDCERVALARVQVVPEAGHMWPVAQGRALAPLIL